MLVFRMRRHAQKRDMHRTVISVHKKYGVLVGKDPKVITISGMSAIKLICGTGSQVVKSEQHSVWQGQRKLDFPPEIDRRFDDSQRPLISSYIQRVCSEMLSSLLMMLMLTLSGYCRHNKVQISNDGFVSICPS